ncbi:hypothetical protein DEO48_09555 [Enterobacter sp. CGMCC 5087]|uniref:hypothetical protein n=1 Tax=Enterobacter sp. CGMCC 5087 TaxID=2183878 RepID=UPI000D67DC61|nr:hypothetical protein [Enterobacter sp. CGMCC 5087]PWI80301.1 hypothetical protein DEO48_09555 [Enterobacter sp. CGMCC 5087]
MSDEENYTDADYELIRVLHKVDDGCDWTKWYVWNMGGRRRISERHFERPPARPQIVPSSIKPKQKRKKKRRKTIEVI